MPVIVKVTKKHFVAKGKVAGSWFACPNCKSNLIFGSSTIQFRFCPMCGIALEWTRGAKDTTKETHK